MAVSVNSLEIVSVLLEAKANPDNPFCTVVNSVYLSNIFINDYNQKESPLNGAARWGRVDIVNKLLLANADIHSTVNINKNTPLLSSISSKNLSIVKLLIEAKSDIEAQNIVSFLIAILGIIN